jgi:hypothetical protein
MKFRASLLCLALLAFAVAPAAAQFPVDVPGQLYLGWGECQGGGGPDFDFLDCSTPDPANSRYLFASAALLNSIPQVIADFGIVDVTVGMNSLVMPDFWQFHSGGCNGGTPAQMQFTADFSTAPGGCHDMWGSSADGGGQYGGEAGPTPSGNRARIKWTWAVFPQSPTVMPGGLQTYTCRIRIRNENLGTCAGCPEPACFVYNEEKITVLDGTTYRVTSPGYASANASPSSINCPGTTPTQTKTWGQVKALYR